MVVDIVVEAVPVVVVLMVLNMPSADIEWAQWSQWSQPDYILKSLSCRSNRVVLSSQIHYRDSNRWWSGNTLKKIVSLGKPKFRTNYFGNSK